MSDKDLVIEFLKSKLEEIESIQDDRVVIDCKTASTIEPGYIDEMGFTTFEQGNKSINIKITVVNRKEATNE